MLVWEKVGVLELGGPRWKIETISDAVKMRSLRSIIGCSGGAYIGVNHAQELSP
jgi:hypothetical protein